MHGAIHCAQIPAEDWKRYHLHGPWQLGSNVCAVCGQPVGVSPLVTHSECTFLHRDSTALGHAGALQRICAGARWRNHAKAPARSSNMQPLQIAAGSGSTCHSTTTCSTEHNTAQHSTAYHHREGPTRLQQQRQEADQAAPF
jgi:hypothetical protein